VLPPPVAGADEGADAGADGLADGDAGDVGAEAVGAGAVGGTVAVVGVGLGPGWGRLPCCHRWNRGPGATAVATAAGSPGSALP